MRLLMIAFQSSTLMRLRAILSRMGLSVRAAAEREMPVVGSASEAPSSDGA